MSLPIIVNAALVDAVNVGTIAGAVFIAVDRTGTVLVERAAGLRVVDRPEPISLNTYFPLYSMTKLVTAIAAMQLVEQNLLALDEPIDDILPELAPRTLKRLESNGVIVDLGPEAPRITLRMLLAHVVGFQYSLANPALKVYLDSRDGVNRPHEFSGLKEPLFTAPVVAEPGTAWLYGTCMDWVGEALARATGQSLGAYCEDRIFAPLGITDMAFCLRDQFKESLIGMHMRDPSSGSLVPCEFQGSVMNSLYDAGGHGAFGTAPSFARILAALLNDGADPSTGAQILEPASVATMFTDQGKSNPVWQAAIRVGEPNVNHIVFGAHTVTSRGWSFAGELNIDSLPSGRAPCSVTWVGAANAYFSVDKNSGAACVLLVQHMPSFDPRVAELWAVLERIVYSAIIEQGLSG